MPKNLSDATALFLYRNVIVPWETKLKNETGCWDVKRSRDALKPADIHLECVEIGEVEKTAKELLISRDKNFIVFVSANSQMKDLFRHIRNCAAHASISSHTSGTNGSTLRFSANLRRRPELAVSGQITSACLNLVMAALVTAPKARSE